MRPSSIEFAIAGALIGLGGLVGCGHSGAPDAGAPADAATMSCDDAGPLSLGRCVTDEGATCDGREATARFAPMPEDGILEPVVGPQASTMFALAARAVDITPGDPERPFAPENPTIEIALLDESGAAIALYRGRAAFDAVAGMEGTFESPRLYVIVDEPPSRLNGHHLAVDARLRDADGRVRCGTLAFVSGGG